jgi:hypothetical protein
VNAENDGPFQQLNQEFEDYAACMAELAQHIESYRTKSGGDVAQRLQEQLDHVQVR